jgi:hypothetical protein
MTEAQRQEAAMMNSMQQAPKAVTPPAKAADDIKWNEKSAAAPVVPEDATVTAGSNATLSVQDVVVNANIVPMAAIQKVEKASGPDRQAYQWKAGAIYGSAEQRTGIDVSQFDAQVSSYLDKTKKRCAGDFAASPDNSWNNASGRIQTYEIACVGKAVNSTASLVFVSKANSFTIFAHESTADQMAEAMEMRDRVVKAVQ